MPRDYPRKLRVAAELQRVLNGLLSSEVKDPRLVGVTISVVHLSGDMGVARIAFSTLRPDEDPGPVVTALKKAGGFLRSRAGQILSVRRVPELRFEHDQGARQGIELTRLIDEVVAKDRDASEAAEDPAQDL
ncbi:MAG: 30S ribosome-binding factor RbfA [Gammaproteobacteria bacterium]